MDQPALQPSPCTCFRMRKLTRLMSQRYDRRLAAAGINLNQYSILRRIGHRTRTVGELARELGMDRTTLSRDLKPLVARGWLEQVAGGDARQRPLRVAAAGTRALKKAMPLWRDAQDEIEAMLGSQRTVRLHAQLDEAIRRLDYKA
jgi:DNA-binding MarR family transcriptional regulator